MRNRFPCTFLGSIFKKGQLFDIYLRRDGLYAVYRRSNPSSKRALALAANPEEIDRVIERQTAPRRKRRPRG